MRRCGTWYALLHSRARYSRDDEPMHDRDGTGQPGRPGAREGRPSVRRRSATGDCGPASWVFGGSRGRVIHPPRARPSSGAPAGLRQVDGLVDEHRVAAWVSVLAASFGSTYMMELWPRIARGRIEQADEARRLRASMREGVDGLAPALEPRLSRPDLTRSGSPSTRSSIAPLMRQRMPPPWWRCGSASPPRSKSTRSHRIRYGAAGSSWMACWSNGSHPLPNTSLAVPPRTSSKRRTVAPRAPASAAHGRLPCNLRAVRRHRRRRAVRLDGQVAIEDVQHPGARAGSGGPWGARRRADRASGGARTRSWRLPSRLPGQDEVPAEELDGADEDRRHGYEVASHPVDAADLERVGGLSPPANTHVHRQRRTTNGIMAWRQRQGDGRSRQCTGLRAGHSAPCPDRSLDLAAPSRTPPRCRNYPRGSNERVEPADPLARWMAAILPAPRTKGARLFVAAALADTIRSVLSSGWSRT